ncbi:hypothetical protein [Micromonospora zamorensis]|uniref:hypothetical protein n=1 Tax=Micromonospora zamorensis TaxID=709883 RepID=UPI00378C268E
MSGADGYAQWQEILACRYFGEAQAGRPVLLFASDEELAELGGSGSLTDAVARHLRLADEARLFWPVEAAVARWRRGSRAEPPPCLPLLAVTVLAATRMHRDERSAPHAYYIRLAEALEPSAPPDDLARLRDRLSQAFDAVAALWRVLDDWLAGMQGQRGISTVRTGGHFHRIGYPLSQALVRAEDRYRLTEFFSALGVDRGGAPNVESMLYHLRIWASRPRGLSPRLVAALQNEADSQLLGGVLSSLAEHWDGVVRERAGLRRAQLRACADIDSWTMWWEVERVPGIDEDVVQLPTGGELKLSVRADGDLYDLDGELPTFPEALRNGLHARGTQLALHVPAADVVAMRKDATIGAWAAHAGVVAFEDQVLLVATTAEAEVSRILEASAAVGWKVARASLLSGWVTFLNVRITDLAAVEGILPGLREGVASALRQDNGILPVLCHGLQVGRGLGRRHYLTGGEPDMLLPAGEQTRMVRAVLNGVEQEFRAAGFPVPLRVLGPLPAGRHDLIADRTNLSFTVVQTLGTEAVPVDPTGAAVQGAWVGTGDPGGQPVLIRRGLQEAYALLDDGTVVLVEEPAAPAWLKALVGAGATYRFEYVPQPGTAWIAERSQLGWRVRPVHPALPAMHQLTAVAQEVWGRLLCPATRIAGDQERWRLYTQAAENLLGR